MFNREAYEALTAAQAERSEVEVARLGKGAVLAQKVADAITAPEADRAQVQAEATAYYHDEIAA